MVEGIVINVDRIIPASEPWWLTKELRPPRKRFDAPIVRRELEAILEEQEGPPPSLQEVARRLRYSVVAMRRSFPELCRQIVAQYAKYSIFALFGKAVSGGKQVKQGIRLNP